MGRQRTLASRARKSESGVRKPSTETCEAPHPSTVNSIGLGSEGQTTSPVEKKSAEPGRLSPSLQGEICQRRSIEHAQQREISLDRSSERKNWFFPMVLRYRKAIEVGRGLLVGRGDCL
jgi:hypothetical protein